MTREPASIEDIEFNALRNALYHTSRRQRLETYSKLLNLAVILGGTATIADLASNFGYAAWVGFVVALVGALQLVFDFAGRASRHEVLQRRFYEVLSRLHQTPDVTEEARAEVMSELMRIYGDEPPTMRALDAVAYNEAVDSMYGVEGAASRQRVNLWQYLTRHMFAYNGTNFAPKHPE